MTKGKFALGALLGAAAGLVAGVLTAPKSGKETRADIKAKAEDMKTEATVKADKVKAEADKKVAEVRGHADRLAKDAKATVNDYKGRGERALAAARKDAEEEFKKKK